MQNTGFEGTRQLSYYLLFRSYYNSYYYITVNFVDEKIMALTLPVVPFSVNSVVQGDLISL